MSYLYLVTLTFYASDEIGYFLQLHIKAGKCVCQARKICGTWGDDIAVCRAVDWVEDTVDR